MANRLPKLQRGRRPQDTADWCAERAAADQIAAASSQNDNIRRRHELSAESWLARAAMLRMTVYGVRARNDAARAEWDEEEVPSRSALRAGVAGLSDVRL